MSRTKQKQERKKSQQLPEEVLDKKINKNYSDIKESRAKLDDYICTVNSKVTSIISSRLNNFVAVHGQIVEGKDNEIRTLQKEQQRMRMSLLNEHMMKLQKTIVYYEQEIERIIKIKDMFKKQAQQFKIELDIKNKELIACKERQKKLIKKLWILEEDIQDIYSNDKPNQQSHHQNTVRKKNITSMTAQPRVHQSLDSQQKAKENRKIIITEPAQQRQYDNLKIRIQQKYQNYRNSIRSGSTNLKQKFSFGSGKSAKIIDSFRSIASTYRQSEKERKTIFKQTISNKFNIYDDLRMNLRKMSRNENVEPKYFQADQNRIGTQQYRLIAIHGPSIMKQIQKVVIQRHGHIKEIDDFAIELLTSLFRNDNAIKILEIVLFNYSVEAIKYLKTKENHLKIENDYDRPSLDSNSNEVSKGIPRPTKIKMELQLRKKFKNKLVHQMRQLQSGRLVTE